MVMALFVYTCALLSVKRVTPSALQVLTGEETSALSGQLHEDLQPINICYTSVNKSSVGIEENEFYTFYEKYVQSQ